MKRCRPPSSIVRWLEKRYFGLQSYQQIVIASCQRSRDGNLMPDTLHVGGSFSLRHFSGGALVNRYPESFYNVHSDRETGRGIDQLSNLNQRSGSENYMQNVGAWDFQQYAGPSCLHSVNESTNTQYLSHDYVDEVGVQNIGHSSRSTAVATQHYSGHWSTNSEPRKVYPSTLSSGYSHSNPQQQNFNLPVSHGHGVHPQQHLIAGTDGLLGENKVDNIEGTLEELDSFCKQWDLVNAVKSVIRLSMRGVNIDLQRYLTLIEVCGEAKALEEARSVHEHLVKFLSPVSTSTFNRMLEMYGKCGSMQDAFDLFDKMPERNLTSWDTMITWYGRNGLGEDAIDMFTKFKDSGLKLDGHMFLGVFDACGVVGDVREGMLHFDSMSTNYGISPTMSHYARIVHMFGSTGDLDGALEFIENMPVEPNADVWESLMNISRFQGNLELGDRCAEILKHLDPSRLTVESSTGLIPVKKPESLKKKVRKVGGLNHRNYEYRAGDRAHPENEKIYALLRGLKEALKEAGYVPETRFVLHDVDQESKEEAIMAHSERLAFAYALMTTEPRSPVRVIKNLRVCVDCHNVFKIFSALVGRLIIMRDAKRFHHFKDGKCSCNDYW